MEVGANAIAAQVAGAPSFPQLLVLVGFAGRPHDIEALLSRCRLAEAFLGSPNNAHVTNFIAFAEREIAAATNFVWPNHSLPSHVEFLRRAARRSNRKSRMKIFTTNYDRCYEEAGRQGRYVIVDGFSHTQPPTFDAIHFSQDVVQRSREGDTHDFIPNVFHLYKLHGSIDWTRDAATGEIYRIHSPNPLLIYPRNSKYELAFEQPYLEMISAFQSALREPNTGVLVVGFGFNDNHLSEPIMAALPSNLGLKIVVVSPGLAPWEADGQAGPGECATNTYLRRISALAHAGDARIALLNCGFEHMLPYVPDIAAESELELHYARLRNVGQI
ncbi:MAG: SIR2 family protein [Pseudomonadota bacterium]